MCSEWCFSSGVRDCRLTVCCSAIRSVEVKGASMLPRSATAAWRLVLCTSRTNPCVKQPLVLCQASNHIIFNKQLKSAPVQVQSMSNTTSTFINRTTENSEKRTSPLIQLVDSNGSVLQILPKSKAIKKAKEDGLKLVLVDGKSKPQPTYQLLTGKELYELEMAQKKVKNDTKNEKKKMKSLKVNTTISEHDLDVKLKTVEQWLEKEQGVQVIIKNTSMDGDKALNSFFKDLTTRYEDVATIRQAKKTRQEMSVILNPKQQTEAPREIPEPLKMEDLKESKSD